MQPLGQTDSGSLRLLDMYITDIANWFSEQTIFRTVSQKETIIKDKEDTVLGVMIW